MGREWSVRLECASREKVECGSRERGGKRVECASEKRVE